MIYNYYPRIDLQLKQFGAICVSKYITRPQFFRVMNYNKSIWKEKHYHNNDVEMLADYLFFCDANDFASKLDMELIPKYKPEKTWIKLFYPSFVSDAWEWTADEKGDTKLQIIRFSRETKCNVGYRYLKRDRTITDRYKDRKTTYGLMFRVSLPLERMPRKVIDMEWKKLSAKKENCLDSAECRNLDFIEKTLDVKI